MCVKLLTAYPGPLLVLAIRDAIILIGTQLGHDLIVSGRFSSAASVVGIAGRHRRLETSLLRLLGRLVGVNAALRTRVGGALGAQTWATDAL